MARRKTVSLDVLLNGQKVGVYERATDGRIRFEYAEDWLRRLDPIPVSLSLPLREQPYIGDDVNAVFENLLPDNDEIRRVVAERSGALGTDAFSLLAEIGRDCVGALQFIPANTSPPEIQKIDAEPISDASIAKRLKNLARAPLGLDRDEDFRISLAGAQEKTAFLKINNEWFLPKGATPTTHILKPPIGLLLPEGIDFSESVENEWLCLTLAREFGLAVAKAEIAVFDGVRALVVERFDRSWARDRSWIVRRPQEDLLQALGYLPALKYEKDGGPGVPQIMDLLKASDHSDEDRNTFLRSQIIFWLMGATDGHAKNFSIHLGLRGSFRLAPLYDILSSDPALAAGQLRFKQMKLAMAVGENRHYQLNGIGRRHWFQTAKLCGVSKKEAEAEIQAVINQVDIAVSNTQSQLPARFPESLVSAVFEAVQQRTRRLDAHH